MKSGFNVTKRSDKFIHVRPLVINRKPDVSDLGSRRFVGQITELQHAGSVVLSVWPRSDRTQCHPARHGSASNQTHHPQQVGELQGWDIATSQLTGLQTDIRCPQCLAKVFTPLEPFYLLSNYDQKLKIYTKQSEKCGVHFCRTSFCCS